MLVTGQKVLQKLRNNSELCLRFSSDFWRLPNLQNIEKNMFKNKSDSKWCFNFWEFAKSKNWISTVTACKFGSIAVCPRISFWGFFCKIYHTWYIGHFYCCRRTDPNFCKLCYRIIFFLMWSRKIFASICTGSLLFAKYRITLWSLTLWVPNDLLVQKCHITHGWPQMTF